MIMALTKTDKIGDLDVDKEEVKHISSVAMYGVELE